MEGAEIKFTEIGSIHSRWISRFHSFLWKVVAGLILAMFMFLWMVQPNHSLLLLFIISYTQFRLQHIHFSKLFLTKDEIEVDLSIDTRVLFWSGIVLGTLSIEILGYAVVRNWWRWKAWRQRRRQTQELNNEIQVQSRSDEESGEVPDGQLCLIYLMRRRTSAFVPCGHLLPSMRLVCGT